MAVNKIEQTLQSYRKAIDTFEKKLQQPKSKITTEEVKAFLSMIKRAKEEHRVEVKKIIVQKSLNALIAQNTANAIRNFLANLASHKGIIETAAIQVLSEIEEELDQEEKFLQEEARNEYNTVGEIDEGGFNLQ